MSRLPPQMQALWTDQREPAFKAFVGEVRR